MVSMHCLCCEREVAEGGSFREGLGRRSCPAWRAASTASAGTFSLARYFAMVQTGSK